MAATQERVDRIAWNLERVEARIKADPDNSNVKGWECRCEEYRQSLVNFARFNQETVPSGNPGVNIEVPLGKFGLKGKV